MSNLCLLVLLATICCCMVHSYQFYSKRELAPSLTLHRLNALKDSIDMLNDATKRKRCQEKARELAKSRPKRMISPSLRLSELLDPLVQPAEQPYLKSGQPRFIQQDINDPCVAFYDDVDAVLLDELLRDVVDTSMSELRQRLQEAVFAAAFRRRIQLSAPQSSAAIDNALDHYMKVHNDGLQQKLSLALETFTTTKSPVTSRPVQLITADSLEDVGNAGGRMFDDALDKEPIFSWSANLHQLPRVPIWVAIVVCITCLACFFIFVGTIIYYISQKRRKREIRMARRRFNTMPDPLTLLSRILDDPCCDPNNPLTLKFSDISLAQHRIQSGIVRTDCRKSRGLSKLFGLNLSLKMEVNQDTGSFKERGARFALLNLNDETKKKGVYAASAGNHALALSMHAKSLGIEVNVVMPKIAPLMKIGRCRDLGARVLVEGEDIAKSREIALRMAKESGGMYINGYDHYDILAGAGTIGLEIIEQVKDVDAILVPVGGCGLIAGVATAVKKLSPTTQVIGICSETCPALIKSLEAGQPVYTPTKPTLADGLAVPNIGYNAFASIKGKVDDVISVPENDIAVAILRLIETEKVVCEGAGAIGIAALLSGKLDHLKGKNVVSILSGGNIDSTSLGRCIDRGLAFDHRVIRVSVIINDIPGGLANLTKLIGEENGNIRDLYLERAFLRNDMSSQRVKMVIEVRGKDQEEHLKEKLTQIYSKAKCSFKTGRLPGVDSKSYKTQ
ncbi:unnamed protein product [Caenorhabditis bovis]|uniref:Serine racemase n=1 Tax=Caenorhabditis bovis TaxID=2654633 RepID=A0A8S1ETS2_9PELO|nr:unnamed protein product [Caenorhabditis bovis]